LDPARGEDAARSTGDGRGRAQDLSVRRERAWRDDRFARERPAAIATMAVGAGLVIAWSAIDYSLERRWFELFLALRLGCIAVMLMCAALSWRSQRFIVIRVAPMVGIAAVGAAVALMLPRVDTSYELYVLGFSLMFWGTGVVMSWPAWCGALTYGLVLAIYMVAHLQYDGARTQGEVWGGLVFLASSVVIAQTSLFLRLRLERRAFELDFSLSERNEDLGRALKELADAQARLVESEKQSALGRLLAGLSHELNNPVNVIANNVDPVRGYVDVLARVATECGTLRRTHPELDRSLSAIAAEEELSFVVEDVRSALDAIEAGSERMRHVHDDLRAFIRGDASKAVTGDVSAGLRATVDMLRRGLKSGVEIEARCAELPLIRHEPGPLNQVFFNLIQNAIDAVGDSGRIDVHSGVTDGWIEIAVSDSGPGLSARAMAHLFEPFFTTKPVRKGTGLGLAISKQIVERQGGQIELADPRTAKFIVRLPIARE
jgi:signal transduction histidine kinase